jgi:hypothetical protein
MSDNLVDARTPEDLQALLEQIGCRLHAKNRIAGGESNFIWYLAEVLRGAGRLSLRTRDDPELDRLFGDGYGPGSVGGEDALDLFLMLRKSETKGT